MGFDPVLSEDGNVFYDPKVNVQDACLTEVSSCQLFVLIIGGRFGSEYKDTTESVTNFEFREAVKTKVPVFALVEQDVHGDYMVFSKNQENSEIDESKINYPSVDSTHIFKFMDEVRGNAANNSLVPFRDFTELESYLKQQWAGMMFNYLTQEGEAKRVADMFKTLTLMNDRIEFLSKQILSSVGTDAAKLTAKLYDIILKYPCIRDLQYINIRPNPRDIMENEDYLSLSNEKWTIVPNTESFVISGSGEIREDRLDDNKTKYAKLREEMDKAIKVSGLPREEFLKEIHSKEIDEFV